MKSCLLVECNEYHHRSGYCAKHFYRFNKYGDPNFLVKKRDRICSIEDCGKKHKSLGYCREHYDSYRGRKDHNPINAKRNRDHLATCSIEDCDQKYYGRGLCRIHHSGWYKKNNPKSRNRKKYTKQELIAMNNVRKRDNNTCQWYGCNKTHNKETPIHVHHIFPKSKYPNFSSIEKYMICYCSNHHSIWHVYRGDKISFL